MSVAVTTYKEGEKEETAILPEPDHHYIRANGKCSRYNLSRYSNVREVLLKSPVPVNIYLHERDKFYARELRLFTSFTGKQSYQVKVTKNKNIEVPGGPCFKGKLCKYKAVDKSKATLMSFGWSLSLK